MVSKQLLNFLQQSSWIRKMFEAGTTLKKELGRENVFDFSLGNPYIEPPAIVIESWLKHLNSSKKGKHSYTLNAGIPEVREFLSFKLKQKYKLAFESNLVIICSGAAAGLNVVFHSLLNPEDEVLVSKPFFPEYLFYAYNHRACLKTVASASDFQLDLSAIDKAITKKTKIFLINSPNNPTGVVYHKQDLLTLKKLLQKHSLKNNQTIYLVSDEPYSQLVYDKTTNPSVFDSYEDSILIHSHSKDLSLAGERIGFIALHPKIEDKQNLIDALIFSNRTLGFVNAPASMQNILPAIFDYKVDLNYYLKLRNLFYSKLSKIGYQMTKPQGAFFLFPKTLEKDDVSFVKTALKYGILLVPGSGFGKEGHFRLSYSVDRLIAERSIVKFQQLFNYYN